MELIFGVYLVTGAFVAGICAALAKPHSWVEWLVLVGIFVAWPAFVIDAARGN